MLFFKKISFKFIKLNFEKKDEPIRRSAIERARDGSIIPGGAQLKHGLPKGFYGKIASTCSA